MKYQFLFGKVNGSSYSSSMADISRIFLQVLCVPIEGWIIQFASVSTNCIWCFQIITCAIRYPEAKRFAKTRPVFSWTCIACGEWSLTHVSSAKIRQNMIEKTNLNLCWLRSEISKYYTAPLSWVGLSSSTWFSAINSFFLFFYFDTTMQWLVGWMNNL